MCSRLSCSGLSGLLGGCRPSRRSYLRSDFALFSYFLSSVVITLVQLPWKQLLVLELQQLVSEVAYGCALVQSPW